MTDIIFEIVDASKRKTKPCAFMSYSKENGFSIQIDESSTVDDVPAFFIPFIERGELRLPDEWSRKWISERIVPSGRQNLGDILTAHGLNEYSAIALLQQSEGKSSHDDFIVRALKTDVQFSDSIPQSRRESLGKLVKNRRMALGLSQKDLADRLRIDQPTLSRLESGKANPSFELLADIDSELNLGNSPLFAGAEGLFWNKERMRVFELLQMLSPELSMTYQRLVNELEMYSHEKSSAIADSLIIAHCLRELINDFPDKALKSKLPNGRQNQENAALDQLRNVLSQLDGLDVDPDRSVQLIPSEVMMRLIQYKKEWEEGNKVREAYDSAAVFGDRNSVGPATLPWESARSFAVSKAHLRRKEAYIAPERSEYLDSLIAFESTILSRYEYVFDIKEQLRNILERANSVDEDGSFEHPTKDEVQKALSLLSRRVAELSFFQNLKNPFWLSALYDLGAFSTYINAAKRGDEVNLYSLESYFKLCTSYEPELVYDLLKKLTVSEEYFIRRLFVEISVEFPVELLEESARTFTKWAKEGYGIEEYFWDPELISPILNTLLDSRDGSYRRIGKQLLSQLTNLRQGKNSSSFYPHIVSCIPYFSYSDFVEAALQHLSVKEQHQLCVQNINLYVSLNEKVKGSTKLGSRWLIASLADQELWYNETSKDLIFTWVSTLKQLLVGSLSKDVRFCRNDFEKGTPIIKRIVIQALTEYILDEPNEIERVNELTNDILQSDCFIDSEYEVEISYLIGAYTKILSLVDIDKYLKLLPTQLAAKKAKSESYYRDRGLDATEVEQRSTREVELFEYILLSQIEGELLPNDYRQKQVRYRTKYSEYDPVQHPISTRTIMGPNSPKSLDELRAMGSQKLLEFLQTWELSKQDGLELIEPSGLSRKLGDLLSDEPFFFVGKSNEVKDLDFIYIDGVFDGWRKAIEESKDIPQEDFADLCLWLSKTHQDDRSLREAQRSAAWTLKRFLERKGVAHLSNQFLEKVIQVISNLSEVEDKDYEIQENEESHDLLMFSMNDIRSVSIENAGKWLLATKDNTVIDRAPAFSVLESALQWDVTRMHDIVALALQIPNLVHSDKQWVDAHYSLLFDSDGGSLQHKIILSSILTYYHPNPKLLEYLKDAVLIALGNDLNSYPKIVETPENRDLAWEIGNWVYQCFVLGALEKEDELFQTWFEKSDEKTKRRVLKHICHMIEQSPDIDAAIAGRVIDLWDEHENLEVGAAEAAQGSLCLLKSHRLPNEWLKSAILKESSHRDLSRSLIRYSQDLLELAEDDPEWGIALLKSLLENDPRMITHRYSRYAEDTLRMFIQYGGSPEDPIFKFCMNKLGEAGWFDLDELVLGV